MSFKIIFLDIRKTQINKFKEIWGLTFISPFYLTEDIVKRLSLRAKINIL